MFIFLNSNIYSFQNLNPHNLKIIIVFKESKYIFDMIYVCYFCKNEFLSRRLLINHIEDRVLIKDHKFPLFCCQPECNYNGQFDSIAQLQRHLISHDKYCNNQLSQFIYNQFIHFYLPIITLAILGKYTFILKT